MECSLEVAFRGYKDWEVIWERRVRRMHTNWNINRNRYSAGHCWLWQTFDAIVVASGHYHTPLVPDIPGLAEAKSRWPDKIAHSKSFRNAEGFEGKVSIRIVWFWYLRQVADFFPECASNWRWGVINWHCSRNQSGNPKYFSEHPQWRLWYPSHSTSWKGIESRRGYQVRDFSNDWERWNPLAFRCPFEVRIDSAGHWQNSTVHRISNGPSFLPTVQWQRQLKRNRSSNRRLPGTQSPPWHFLYSRPYPSVCGYTVLHGHLHLVWVPSNCSCGSLLSNCTTTLKRRYEIGLSGKDRHKGFGEKLSFTQGRGRGLCENPS